MYVFIRHQLPKTYLGMKIPAFFFTRRHEAHQSVLCFIRKASRPVFCLKKFEVFPPLPGENTA